MAALAVAGLTAVSASAQPVARTLTVDRTEVGHLRIDGSGVETWWLDGTAGQVVSVSIRSRSFRASIHIVSPTGEELARDDGRGPLDTRRDPRLVAHLRTSGRYVVRVATAGRGASGAYEVTARALEVRPIEADVPARGRYENTGEAMSGASRGRRERSSPLPFTPSASARTCGSRRRPGNRSLAGRIRGW